MDENQRERVIVLASNMFIREGIKAVRMDDIAHRAAISKRTLYEMFGDKEKLLYLAISHHLDQMDAENNAVAHSTDNVLIAYLMVTQNVIQHSTLNWRLLKNLKRFYPEINQRIEEERSKSVHNNFKYTLEMGVKQGFIRESANIDLAIVMITSIVNRVVTDSAEHFYIPLPSGETAQSALYEMVTYFLRGIATRKGVDIIDEFIASKK